MGSTFSINNECETLDEYTKNLAVKISRRLLGQYKGGKYNPHVQVVIYSETAMKMIEQQVRTKIKCTEVGSIEYNCYTQHLGGKHYMCVFTLNDKLVDIITEHPRLINPQNAPEIPSSSSDTIQSSISGITQTSISGITQSSDEPATDNTIQTKHDTEDNYHIV